MHSKLRISQAHQCATGVFTGHGLPGWRVTQTKVLTEAGDCLGYGRGHVGEAGVEPVACRDDSPRQLPVRGPASYVHENGMVAGEVQVPAKLRSGHRCRAVA